MSGPFDWKWEKKGLTCPVTSVEFTGELVLSGNGPFLSVCSVTSGIALKSKCLLERSRIHGIRVEPKCGNLVAIFGQKMVRIARLERGGRNLEISLEPVTDIVPFPDLLWDVHWLYHRNSETEVASVAIATAHNAIWCWDWVRNLKQPIAQCEESCILYSARFFGCYLSNLVIASGTVFNQILLWKVHGETNEKDRTKIFHRLSGHEGVIFSLNFNKTGTLLSSVPDDRSIRLWKISNLLSQESNSCIEPLLVVYGHAARVWDCRLLETYFVSIGEDLVCNVWTYGGILLKSYKGHTGRNIWSLAVNETEDLIATGGGDGSVRLWPLFSPEHHHDSIVGDVCLPHVSGDKTHRRKDGKNDYPRFVSVLDPKTLLIMTNEGCLYKHSWLTDENMERNSNSRAGITTECSNSSDTWMLLFQDKEYASYSVVSLSPCHAVIAFGSLQGRLKLQHLDFRCPHVEVEAYSGKVHSVLWSTQHSSQHLFSCGPDGQMTWWHVKLAPEEPSLSIHPLCSFVLPPSKQRWASTVEIFVDPSLTPPTSGEEKWIEEYLVVCGDRKGSLHLFDPTKAKDSASEFIKPSHSLPSIHGKAGVSQVCLHRGQLYSAGRDGVYRLYNVQRNSLELIDTRKVFKGLDWLERLVFTVGGDLLIAGFHAAFFVLWSVQRNQLLWKVKCGGAHRAWDIFLYQLLPEFSFSEGVLSYIKDSRVCTHKVTLRSELRNAVLKPSFHGREVTCICYLDSIQDEQGDTCDVFATGSEDTNINIMTTNRKTGVNSMLYLVHGHISSVRALSVTKYSSPKLQQEPVRDNSLDQHGRSYLLFSGGGRASLKCWRVNLSLVEASGDGFHGGKTRSSPVAYLGEYSFRSSNHKRRRKRNNDHALSEIRFMSLTSFSASELMDHSVSVDMMDRCQSLYFVMSACSDGFVRIFSFYTRLNKFFLMAQSQYLKRCVLTVTHLLERCVNANPLVMLFAGGTAGKIFAWDISVFLLNYIEEYCELNLKKTSCMVTSATEHDDYVQEAPAEEMVTLERCNPRNDSISVIDVHAKEGVTNDEIQELVINSHAKEGATNDEIQELVSNSHAKEGVTNDEIQELVMNSHAKEGVTNDEIQELVINSYAKESVTNDEIRDLVVNSHVKENMTNEKIQEHVTDRHAIDDVTKTFAKRVDLEAEYQEVVTGDRSETDKCKLSDRMHSDEERNVSFLDQKYPDTLVDCSSSSPGSDIHQMLNTMSEDPTEFSCVPLVQCFLATPSHEFKAHQSGVNAIVLVKMQEPGHYRLVSGGDDGALYTAEFHLTLTRSGLGGVHMKCEASLPSAHTSSVTGEIMLPLHRAFHEPN